MSIAWVNTAALWGMALLAIPIAIHLLVRQQTRVVAYPSLRFVRETALAAFRRRAIQDALLLLCRAAIVAAAVLATAGPIVQTAARTAGYADRISRAIVQIDGSAIDDVVEGEAFRSRTFRRRVLADALSEATRWLNAQPPSAREIVFVGTFSKGHIAAADLQTIPNEIGLRFVEADAPPARNAFVHTTLVRRGDRLVFSDSDVSLSADATEMSAAEVSDAPADLIRVVAAAKDRPLADAALRAVLGAGVRWPDPKRRLVVEWDSAEAAATSPPGVDVVRMMVPDPPMTAATALRNGIESAMPQDSREPIAIARGDLDAWSQPASGAFSDARPVDEGDRRWLWAAALILLAIEYRMRRERGRHVQPQEERHVA